MKLGWIRSFYNLDNTYEAGFFELVVGYYSWDQGNAEFILSVI